MKKEKEEFKDDWKGLIGMAIILIALILTGGCAKAQPTTAAEDGFEHPPEYYYQLHTCRTDMECTHAAANAGWPEEDWP
jgi:hypothetical protein